VALLAALQYALPGYSDRRDWVQGPGWPNHLCQDIAVYALRLNSQARAGTEGSTLSSLNCDRWLILGLEALSPESLLEPLITDDKPLHVVVSH